MEVALGEGHADVGLGEGALDELLAEQRLFLLDYEILHGLEPQMGRFCVAPIALFWKDDLGRLMPLAIQLGQSPAEAETISRMLGRRPACRLMLPEEAGTKSIERLNSIRSAVAATASCPPSTPSLAIAASIAAARASGVPGTAAST